VRAVAAAVVLLAALVRPALAEPSIAVRLEVAPPGNGCDLAALEARVVRLLEGRDPFDAEAALVLRVTSEGTEGRVQARLVVVDQGGGEHGARVLVAASCAELMPALALVIALAVRSEAAGTVDAAAPGAVDAAAVAAPAMPVLLAAPAPPPPPPPPPAPASRAATHRARASAPPRPQRRTTAALIAGAAGAGESSGRGWQARLVGGVRLRRGWWSLGAELELHAPEEIAVGSGEERIRIETAAAALIACGHLGAATLCGTAGGGWIGGHGLALVEARAATTPLAALGVRLGWELPLSRQLALRLHLDGRALLTTSRFLVDDRSVWTSSRQEAWLGTDLIATFP
jgi:hypothetical protein